MPAYTIVNLMEIENRAKSGKDQGIETGTIVLDDEGHRLARHVAGVGSFHNVLAQTDLAQLHEGTRILQDCVPVRLRRHEQGNRLLRLDIYVVVSAVGAWMIRAAGVVVSGIQTDILVVCRLPIEDAILRECGAAAR